MRIQTLVLMLGILVSFISGCGGSNRFDIMDRTGEHGEIPLTALVLQFEDTRPFGHEYNATLANIPIFGIKGAYYHDRHDSIFEGSVTPFAELLPMALAERLRMSDTFSEVVYASRDEMPPVGSYDVIIDGKIIKLQSRGAIIKYGFSKLADVLWYLGFPNVARRWVIDVEYKVMDGYTMEPVAGPLNTTLETKHTYLTRYYTRAQVKDLENDIDPVYDELIAHIWDMTPPGSDEYWVALREDGQEMLAEARRRQQEIERGAVPVFQFLAPPDETVVRSSSVSLRWRIDAPGGLRSAALVVNNQPVELGIDVLALSDPGTAPKSLPAKEISIPLQLGENVLAAQVTDHRGNDPQRVSINITRLPRAVEPAERFALLINPQSAGGAELLKDLQSVLASPMLGQFDEDDVYTVSSASLDSAALETALQGFAPKPLANNLAVIYLRSEGDWEDMTIGEGVSLDGMLGDLQRMLATDQVVLLLDIDWSGTADGALDTRLQNLPPRWAVLATTPNGEASPQPALAEAIVETMTGEAGGTRRLTLQRFLDNVRSILDEETSARSEVYGRFDPDVVMAERE